MRRGGETDLVVDDDVHGAAGAMPAQTRQTEAFGDDALPRKCRITVQQDRHGLGAGLVVLLVLFGAHFTQHDRIHGLKVGRVRGE